MGEGKGDGGEGEGVRERDVKDRGRDDGGYIK